MRPALFTAVLLAACAPSTPGPAPCEAPAADNARFPDDAALSELLDSATGLPGVAMLVVDPALGNWVGTRGFANLESRVLLSACHQFEAGSITKLFTAISILQLVERGQLSLEQKLEEVVPPGEVSRLQNARGATLRQLLSHTSGLANFTDSAFVLRVLNDPDHVFSVEELLDAAARAPRVGDRFLYANTNFELLGLVAQHQYGAPVGTIFEEHLTRPLGLTRTALATTAGEAFPDLATGYFRHNGALVTVSQRQFQLSPAGGVVTTLSELAHFLEGLRAGTLVSPQLLAEMKQWVPAGKDSAYSDYGLGLMQRQPGVFGHSGTTAGFAAHAYFFEASGRTVVMFTNSPSDGGLLRRGIEAGTLR